MKHAVIQHVKTIERGDPISTLTHIGEVGVTHHVNGIGML